MSDEKGIRAHLGGHLRENGMLLALLAIVAFFTILLQLGCTHLQNTFRRPFDEDPGLIITVAVIGGHEGIL